jgi:hypothetical protein
MAATTFVYKLFGDSQKATIDLRDLFVAKSLPLKFMDIKGSPPAMAEFASHSFRVYPVALKPDGTSLIGAEQISAFLNGLPEAHQPVEPVADTVVTETPAVVEVVTPAPVELTPEQQALNEAAAAENEALLMAQSEVA